MRIAIDISIQDTPYLTGVEKAQRAILQQLCHLDEDHEYLLISRRPVSLPFALPPNFRVLDLEQENPGYLWRERLLPPLFHKQKIEVFHSPVSAIPVLGKVPKVATIHEIPWVERRRGAEPIRRGKRVWLFLNTRYAARIVAVSQRTKDNILALYPDAASKVEVIHHGVDEMFGPEWDGPPRGEFLSRYGIPDQPYLLFVGTLRRKKNLIGLLKAFRMLPEELRRTTQLLLVGVRNVTLHDLEQRVEEIGLTGRVHFPGYVPDEDLPAFYHHAEALVYPSLFEGFGLPPLEAFATGTPVICSTGGAIPEIVDQAAAQVDPKDPEGFAAEMARLLTDQEYAAELRARGLERVKCFTWKKSALAHLQLWESLAGQQSRAAP